MRLFRRRSALPGEISCLFLVGVSAIFYALQDGSSASAAPETYPCRQKLSKKGAMIFDNVQQKRTVDSNLEEIWKEETRDLITANILGREEATNPAMEALNCLRSPEP